MSTLGGFLVYASINDVPVVSGLRDIARGQLPKGNPSKGSATVQKVASNVAQSNSVSSVGELSGEGSSIGPALVNDARRYLGVPYKWGGSNPKTGLDCSGLVQLCFKDVGITDCPRTSATIHLWSKLRKTSNVAVGDILWWNGHVAIASSDTHMIEAPTVGIPVRETTIRRGYTSLRYVG